MFWDACLGALINGGVKLRRRLCSMVQGHKMSKREENRVFQIRKFQKGKSGIVCHERTQTCLNAVISFEVT